MQSEAEVVKQCVEYMHKLGWRPKRNHVGTFYTRQGVPIKIGEKGEPDWLFTHPAHPAIWLEFKANNGRPKPEQIEFLAKLRHFGYHAEWTNSLCVLKIILQSWGIPCDKP